MSNRQQTSRVYPYLHGNIWLILLFCSLTITYYTGNIFKLTLSDYPPQFNQQSVWSDTFFLQQQNTSQCAQNSILTLQEQHFNVIDRATWNLEHLRAIYLQVIGPL